MKVPFTWKVTGWFMVGWSPEIPVGAARPPRYFGEDLVAYRDDEGVLHVVEGHCKHLGWRWGPDGANRPIPYQPYRTGNVSRRAGREPVHPLDDPDDLALRFHSHLFGPGGAISVFESAQNHQLFFTCTPVDDECSDLSYSIWWPRLAGDPKYVENPRLSREDAKGYLALRNWAAQFYEVPA